MGEPAWAEWIGRVEERTDALSPHVASMLAAALSDGEARDLSSGAPMPPLWHWAAFHTDAAHDELGPGGHPKLGRFLPPVPLERRMWAGGRLAFHAPLAIGEEMRRRSEILKVSEKGGGAGPMVFVTVGHRIEGERGFAIEEEQDIVYIAMPDAYRPPKPVPAPDGAAFDIAVAMDTRRLFRYSAATFNAHRIHYDLPYAMGVEKYPGLVVHGPIQATLLMGAAIRHRGGSPARFRFRGVHPMFHTHDLRLIGLDDGAAMELCTAAPPADGGHQGLRARAEWA